MVNMIYSKYERPMIFSCLCSTLSYDILVPTKDIQYFLGYVTHLRAKIWTPDPLHGHPVAISECPDISPDALILIHVSEYLSMCLHMNSRYKNIGLSVWILNFLC